MWRPNLDFFFVSPGSAISAYSKLTSKVASGISDHFLVTEAGCLAKLLPASPANGSEAGAGGGAGLTPVLFSASKLT